MTVRKTIPDLLPGRGYAIRVRAKNGSTVSNWSTKLEFVTTNGSDAPETPTNVTWDVVGDSFHGEWDAVTQNVVGDDILVIRYDVRLTAGATTKTISVLPADAAVKVTYDLTFLSNVSLFTTPQPTVSISVRAVDNHGLVSSYTTPVSATNPPPGPPANLTTVAGVDSLDISWDESSDDDLIGYEAYVGTSSGFTPGSGNKIYSGSATRFTYTSTTYSLQYFKVRAIDKFNQASTYALTSGTPVSPFGSDGTAPDTPTGLTATITTLTDATLATSADVSWDANSESDLAGYYLQFRENGTTPWSTVRYDKTTTSSLVTNLTPYVDYDFRISAVDFSENQSTYSSVFTATGATNSAPSTPAAPSVSTSTLQAQVTVSGNKAAGGAMESDVTFYEVYGSTSTGFTPSSSNMLGVIPVGPAMVSTFDIPASGGGSTQTWYFKIIAVDNGGLKSSASSQTSGTPGLIQATNITDATITNAKINDLAADKITAGSGIINNLTVKSILTIGDASTTGSVQSFDYSAGTTGYKISSVGGNASLEINQGVIRTPALLIQKSGTNIMNPKYADFELSSGFYTSSNLTATNATVVQSTAQKMFNTASLSYSPTNATNSVFLGSSNTDYNINVQPDTDYIISFYSMVQSAGTAATLTASLKYATASTPGTLNLTGASVPANSTWARYYGTVSVPGTATGGAILSFSTNTSTGTVFIDGIQIEEKMSSATTPSSWSKPGSTTIDGYQIRTGSLISSGTTTVNGNTIPWWSINESGSAQFANLQVRGNAIVGVASGTDGGASTISSGNYVTGTSGWQLKSDGSAEFTAGAVAQTFTGAKFQTDSSGNRLVIRDDGSEGVIEFYAGVSGETAGYINPNYAILGHYAGTSHSITFSTSKSGTLTPGIMMLGSSTSILEPPSLSLLSGTGLYVDGDATFNSSITGTGGFFLSGGGNINGSVLNNSGITSGGDLTGNRLITSGLPTSAAAANVRLNADGVVRQVTSVRAHKTDIKPMTNEQAHGLLKIEPVTFYDKGEVKQAGGTKGLKRIPGLIAEDVERHAPLFADYHDGKLVGVQYDRIVTALLIIVSTHEKEITNLKNQINKLSV